MEVRIAVEKILPLESGVSKAGNGWRKLTFIGSTFDEYPKHIAFVLFNDAVEKYQPLLQPKSDLNVSFDISSREWTDSKGNSRWSTDVNVWKVEAGTNTAPSQPQPAPQPQPNYDQQAAAYFAAATSNAPQPAVASPQPIDSDLPF